MLVEVSNDVLLGGLTAVSGFIGLLGRIFWAKLDKSIEDGRRESAEYRARLQSDIDSLRAELRECYQGLFRYRGDNG